MGQLPRLPGSTPVHRRLGPSQGRLQTGVRGRAGHGQALRRHAARCEEARKCADYIQRNEHRMHYPAFHAQGLCTSSGVVEAGCKVTVGTRLKRAGMHWSLRGANAIIALRCCRLSGRFEDFWERRAQKRAA